ncbi:MAG: alpha/beta hydrolase [Proteobacteria bacterium]|nr:alpha/beta hydrolase [Pseudomonadota bacterium]
MAFLERKDGSIYYETIGTMGPWLTFINGHTRSSRDFRILTGKLSKNGLRCLIFDNRGSGETKCKGPFKLEDIADDVKALWDNLEIKQSSLVGLSMGGIIAQILAYKYSYSVTGLILIATGTSEKSLSPKALAPWGDSITSVEAKLESYFTPEFCKQNQIIVRAMSKQILDAILNGNFEAQAQIQRDAMIGMDTQNFLSSLKQATLILHGLQDQIIPVREAEEIAKLIPHAELKKIEGIGHLVLAEYGSKLSEDILSFLKHIRVLA